MYRIGLAGNPNCGKTTLFNLLTNSNAHVGNWPGVTVTRKEGVCQRGKDNFIIIDLPGIYSLSPYSPEEMIARNFLVKQTPDLILNVVDASNLERNLYFTTQLLELDCPVVIALNMMDILEKRGQRIDGEALSKALLVDVIPISAANHTGIEALMKAAAKNVNQKRNGYSILFDSALKIPLEQVGTVVRRTNIPHPIFQSVKVLEKDIQVRKEKKLVKEIGQLDKIVEKSEQSFSIADMEAACADYRYRRISQLCEMVIDRKKRETATEKIDKLFMNEYWGIPIFFGILFFIFHLTFSKNLFGISSLPSPGVFLQNGMEIFCTRFGEQLHTFLKGYGTNPLLLSLISDGILGGVGAVLSFIPQIICLFLFLSVLEESGYMARVAFLLDKPLKKLGLSGKAFLPLIMGFGCSVPAIMATRTLERQQDRRLAILLIPFLSCGAKLPLYVLFGGALFPEHADKIIFVLYLLGVMVAILSAVILKRTIFCQSEAPFILELPDYHKPDGRSLILLLWEKLRDYFVRAGTLILISSVIIWFLSNFSFSLQQVNQASQQSILGQIGKWIVPFFKPLGFADGQQGYQSCVAILSGFMAKEAVVSSLGVLYHNESLASIFTPLQAMSFMVFHLLSIPCIAAVSAMKTEMKSWHWTVFALLFWLGCAWFMAFCVFQAGRVFLGL